MAVKINNVEVVTDARQLKIRSTDDDVKETLRAALREDNDYIRILDSNGNAIHTFWGANAT